MGAINFGNLYDYVTNSGIVIPLNDNDQIRQKVAAAVKECLGGGDIDTTAQSAVGRLIEAITLLFIDILGITAQNVGCLNPSVAVGAYLDALGAVFGVDRLAGQTDAQYRTLLMAGLSSRQGYVPSIYNAISRVAGVTKICVLENNLGNNAAVPNDVNGITIPPHSIFVCVKGGASNDIAQAIYKTKSAGCGYTTSRDYGTPETVGITDSTSGTTSDVVFYRPQEKNTSEHHVKFKVKIGGSLTSDDVQKVKDAILTFVENYSNNATITPTMAATAVSIATGLYCSESVIEYAGQSVTSLGIRPYEILTIDESSDIEVISA